MTLTRNALRTLPREQIVALYNELRPHWDSLPASQQQWLREAYDRARAMGATHSQSLAQLGRRVFGAAAKTPTLQKAEATLHPAMQPAAQNKVIASKETGSGTNGIPIQCWAQWVNGQELSTACQPYEKQLQALRPRKPKQSNTGKYIAVAAVAVVGLALLGGNR